MEALILTKSRMKSHGVSGLCTTAYDLQSGTILRFVSDPSGTPIVNPYNGRYDCLDIVDVNILKSCPIGPQTENVLVDQRSFKQLGKYNGNLCELLKNIQKTQSKGPLFLDDSVLNKLISVDNYNHSLEIKRVSNLTLTQSAWGSTSAAFQAKSSRGTMLKHMYYYVTDRRYELGDKAESQWVSNDAFIVVSIPHSPHTDGFYYKFIAAVYPLEAEGETQKRLDEKQKRQQQIERESMILRSVHVGSLVKDSRGVVGEVVGFRETGNNKNRFTYIQICSHSRVSEFVFPDAFLNRTLTIQRE